MQFRLHSPAIRPFAPPPPPGFHKHRYATGASSTPQTATLSLQHYDDTELLWLQYGRQLKLSKSAIYASLQDVQLGALPCDAELLRSRTAAFAALGQQGVVPGLDALRVLNTSRHALHHDPEQVRRTLEQLLQLLPGSPPTQLLLDTLADLDLPPEILALQHQEADAAFRACLGAHVTPAALHHMLQGWRRQHQEQPHTDRTQQQQQQQQQEQQQQWPAAGGQLSPQQQQPQQQLARQEGQPRPPLTQQVAALAELLGPEVAYAAMRNTPELLDAEPARILANLRWLQQQLQLSPVAALLLAQTAGGVLLLPSRVLEARYSNLCYLLLQLLGWKLRQAHTLLCNAPQLLGSESAVLASNWQLVQQLVRRRSRWLEELAGGSQGVVAAVLGAEQRALQQLRYAAEARELRGCGLVRVLRMPYVDFLHACPGFRVWRGAVPAEKQRWSLVEAGSCVVSVGPDAGQPRRQQMGGKVLAVDKRGSPVLIQLA